MYWLVLGTIVLRPVLFNFCHVGIPLLKFTVTPNGLPNTEESSDTNPAAGNNQITLWAEHTCNLSSPRGDAYSRATECMSVKVGSLFFQTKYFPKFCQAPSCFSGRGGLWSRQTPKFRKSD